MMKKTFIITSLLAVTLFSCKKENEQKPSDLNDSNITNGISNSESYLPIIPNSTFTYELSSEKSDDVRIETIEFTNNTKEINDFTYREVKNSGEEVFYQYMRADSEGNVYSTIENDELLSNANANLSLEEILVMKNNSKVGDSWINEVNFQFNENGMSLDSEIKANSTVKNILENFSVKQEVYNDIIVIETIATITTKVNLDLGGLEDLIGDLLEGLGDDVDLNDLDSDIDLSDVEGDDKDDSNISKSTTLSYYAKGIGLIYSESSEDGKEKEVQTLTSYSVN